MITADQPRSDSGATSTAARHRRETFGFLTANIHVGASRPLWRGVLDQAESHDINLICFPGGGLRVAKDFEAQRNILYDLAHPSYLDGLVSWSSTITGSLEPADVIEFHRHYHALPIISLVQPIAGTPTLAVDSYQGMRAAIIHLIEVHGLTRLALIRGPAGHYYAQERYRAYLDVLEEYGLPVVPALISRPMHWQAGAEAIQMLLDEAQLRPGRDFEAIIAVSDLLALGALKALQARGLRVPHDLAIVGFNDSAEGRLASPPMTSVALPLYEQGARAIDMLLERCAGEPLPAELILPSQLVVRQSCGCLSTAVANAAIGAPAAPATDLAEAFAALHASLPSAMAETLARARTPAPTLLGLLRAFEAALRDQAGGGFLSALEQALEPALALDTMLDDWQNIISALRRRILPALDGMARQRAEDLLGQARVLIGEVAQRAQAFQQLQAERQSTILREIGQALITTFDIATLAGILAEQLPQIGIRSGYLALYENPAAPEWARLVLTYTEHGRSDLAPEGQRFRTCEFVPAELLPQRRYSLVVEPLYFREDQIGFVALEVGPRDPTIYEVLRGHISSALKGALLVRETQQARVAAEKADQIKTRLLANVSHELRTPLHIILEHTKAALGPAYHYGIALPSALQHDIQYIQNSAEHQLRLINDLLDLSRAEIDELDLYPELIDARALLTDAFQSLADCGAPEQPIEWQLQLPERLPLIYADAVRLRQILLNVLSNAKKFTERGHIRLGADVAPPNLHIWVEDTGAGIAREQQERIFEPFVTAAHSHDLPSVGIGLGLSITHRLVALHSGTISLESRPGAGSTFHIYLPLPSLSEQIAQAPAQSRQVLLVISASAALAAEIVEFSQRQGLEIQRLRADEELEQALQAVQPIAIAWDLVDAGPSDWVLVRRLRGNPRWAQLPFILYGQDPIGETTLSLGLTSFVAKPSATQTLVDTISALCPARSTGPILIVDDDPQARAQHEQLVRSGLPGYPIRSADTGLAALSCMAQEIPSLVLLDLVMPEMDGSEVLDWMRADPRLRQIPVVILSSKLLSLDDVKRLEQHAHVALHNKGMLSQEEMIATLNRALFDTDTLPPYTGALVKRTVAYLHQNYARAISRWELAEAAGVSEDYLSRVFNRELGLSPWEYLNRYRVYQAKELLLHSGNSISSIAHRVGFQDQKYFSRVFRKLTGCGPQEFRESAAR